MIQKPALRRFYQQKITNLHNLTHPLALDQELFTESDLFTIYDAVINDDPTRRDRLDLYRFKPLIQSFKVNILGGSSENYNVRDLRSLFLVGESCPWKELYFLINTRPSPSDIKIIPAADVPDSPPRLQAALYPIWPRDQQATARNHPFA
jgi:hypothetical protein